MPASSSGDPLLVEVATLRHELSELRREQQELRQAMDELVRTFRSIAMHLGIAAEPYRKASAAPEKSRDLPGFA